MTRQTAAYTARYVMKKMTGPNSQEHYERLDQETGEIAGIEREFVRASLRPGLGYDWFKKYSRDVYPHDFVVVDGKKEKPPRYYDKLLERENPALMEKILKDREDYAELHQEDNTPRRLEDREHCQNVRLKQLHRRYELDS